MTRSAPKKDPFRLKLAMVMFCLILAGAAVATKAFVLASLESEKLAELARSEYHQTVEVSPDRGLIYDRNGVELAVSVQVDSIYVRPALIEDRPKTASALAQALGMKRGRSMRILNKRHPFVWVKRLVEPHVAEQVRELNLKGVGNHPREPEVLSPPGAGRPPPAASPGSTPTGWRGWRNSTRSICGARAANSTRKIDARRRPIYISGQSSATTIRGNDLVLTIDKRIQYLLERALKESVVAHKARSAMGLAMVPSTGEILASASVPGYNPNVFSSFPAQNRRNRVVTDPFEPGSTFKVFTLAAALDAGLITPGTIIDLRGGREVPDRGPHHP